MKAKAETLGPGFYLCLVLLFVACLLWVRMAPRRLDPDFVNRINSRPLPTMPVVIQPEALKSAGAESSSSKARKTHF